MYEYVRSYLAAHIPIIIPYVSDTHLFRNAVYTTSTILLLCDQSTFRGAVYDMF